MRLYEFANPFSVPAVPACQPGMILLRDWLLDRFPGTTFLGCRADRPVTGTTTVPSLHRDGRAIDIGTISAAQSAEIVETLVRHADRLGLQMVLDYRNGRRWRLPYTPGDQAAGWATWTKPGHWLHIERTRAGAADPTPINTLIGVPPTPPAPTTPVQEDHAMQLETLALGARGPLVRFVQEVLAAHWPNPAGKRMVVDGVFGEQTAVLVRLAQRANKLPESGVVDAPTWRAVIVYANRATS